MSHLATDSASSSVISPCNITCAQLEHRLACPISRLDSLSWPGYPVMRREIPRVPPLYGHRDHSHSQQTHTQPDTRTPHTHTHTHTSVRYPLITDVIKEKAACPNRHSPSSKHQYLPISTCARHANWMHAEVHSDCIPVNGYGPRTPRPGGVLPACASSVGSTILCFQLWVQSTIFL